MKRSAAICIFGMLVLGAHIALAQTAFPSRVVKIIVPIKMPDVQERFRAASVEPVGITPAATTAFINAEAQRWSAVIQNNNITVD